MSQEKLCFVELDGWLVDWLVGWLIGWLVGWLVGLAGWLFGWLVSSVKEIKNLRSVVK